MDENTYEGGKGGTALEKKRRKGNPPSKLTQRGQLKLLNEKGQSYTKEKEKDYKLEERLRC